MITKTVTIQPRAGNAPARIAETASGMLNSIGLENVGLHRFRTEKLPRLRALRATVIASLGGETPEELETLLGALGQRTGDRRVRDQLLVPERGRRRGPLLGRSRAARGAPCVDCARSPRGR